MICLLFINTIIASHDQGILNTTKGAELIAGIYLLSSSDASSRAPFLTVYMAILMVAILLTRRTLAYRWGRLLVNP
jgi:ABC-type branched-subunit amino acid transport system permease subunit